MEGMHMEPLALWGDNEYAKPTSKTIVSDIHDYVALFIPRDMLRPAASKFSDVRHAESKARFDEINLQLFLQMVYETANLPLDQMPTDVYPYVSAWLQWIPSSTIKENASGYIVHAVSHHKDVKFGNSLNKMLFESGQLHRDSMDRKSNTRKADPLSGLQNYQKWMCVSGVEMYVRTVADRYVGSQRFTSQMDAIINPKRPLSEGNNVANPKWVFSIDNALDKIPESADDAFKSRVTYTGQANSNEPVLNLEFPTEKHVIRLTPAQLHPKIFCQKYLPDHQVWMEAQRAIPAKPIDDQYDPNCETEYDIRTPQDLERARLDGMADRSAFASLAYQAKVRYAKDCGPLEHVPGMYEPAYKAYQDWAVKALTTQCLDPDACISDVVSKMLTWRQQQSKHQVICHQIKDPSLSVFANRAIVLFEGYEQYYLISTAHRMMYLIHHARYDAFRRDFGLHLNCFQAGDGATSKSFLFLVMEEESIPGTTEVLTYQTGKADAIDGNRNDICTVCHEAPPGMFRTAKNPNADSSQETMFKEKLTSQRVTCKTFYQDESTGKRSARLTKSECIGVWMGATNDAKGDVEEALQTRFFWGNFEQQQRRGRDIDDCMNGERMMSAEDKAHRKRLFEEAREEQFRVMLVEKAIWTRVIKDVNNTASNILIPRFKSKMTKNSIIRPGPRDWERVKLFARNQAIVTAIERVCNLPGGKHYGVPFNEGMIPDLEPFLKVTEEMVLYTLSLFADQFRSPVEHKILNTVWAMEKSNPQFGNPFNTADTACMDYIKLPRLRQLGKKINSRIPLEKGRTSTNNIEDFLLKMTKHSFQSKPYKVPAVGADPTDSKFPVLDAGKRRKKYDSCVINSEGTFVHVAHILNHACNGTDSVFDTLASETHKYSAHKRILTACPLSGQYFHVMRVIDRAPGGRGIQFKNVLANTEQSRYFTGTSNSACATRTAGTYSIVRDIDDEVALKWTAKIGKESQTPWESVEFLVAEDLDVRTDIRYPDCLMLPGDAATDKYECSDEEVATGKRVADDTGDEPDAKRPRKDV